MDRYTVQHSYRAWRDGRLYGPWLDGETVELSAEDAAWVNRDSPGTLAPTAPALSMPPTATVEDQGDDEDQGDGQRARTPRRNRAHKGGLGR